MSQSPRTSRRTLQDDRTAWAREALEVDQDASDDELRRTVLARVRQSDFVPPLAWREAITLLGDRPGPSTECFDRDARAKLVERIATFSARFFSLPVEKRRRVWQRLADSAEPHPELTARLHALKSGLHVDVASLDGAEEDVVTVGRMVCSLFVASPGERAHRRRKWLHEHGRSNRWRAAVATLEREHADVARLEPEFVSRATSSRSGDFTGILARPSPARRRERRPAQTPVAVVPELDPGGGGGPGWTGGGIVLLVLVLLRIVIAIGDSTTSSSSRPSFSMPTYTPPRHVITPPIDSLDIPGGDARLLAEALLRDRLRTARHVFRPGEPRAVVIVNGEETDYDPAKHGPWLGEGLVTRPMTDNEEREFRWWFASQITDRGRATETRHEHLPDGRRVVRLRIDGAWVDRPYIPGTDRAWNGDGPRIDLRADFGWVMPSGRNVRIDSGDWVIAEFTTPELNPTAPPAAEGVIAPPSAPPLLRLPELEKVDHLIAPGGERVVRSAGGDKVPYDVVSHGPWRGRLSATATQRRQLTRLEAARRERKLARSVEHVHVESETVNGRHVLLMLDGELLVRSYEFVLDGTWDPQAKTIRLDAAGNIEAEDTGDDE